MQQNPVIVPGREAQDSSSIPGLSIPGEAVWRTGQDMKLEAQSQVPLISCGTLELS